MSSSEKPPQSLTTPQIVATPSTPGTSPPPSPEEEGALVRPASPPPRIVVLESSHVTRTQSEQLLCTMDTINECEEGESGRRGSAVKISLSEECISTSTVSTPLESSPTSPVQALPPQRCTPYISRYTHVAYSYDWWVLLNIWEIPCSILNIWTFDGNSKYTFCPARNWKVVIVDQRKVSFVNHSHLPFSSFFHPVHFV